jgi:peptidoglycan hydrolase CwlO-like protein
MEWITPISVLIGIIASSYVTYKIAKRTTSGSISTSEAATLWKESNDLRQEYRKRAEVLEQRLQEVNNKLQSVMDELGKLRLNSASMIEKIAELKRIIEELREENKRLLALKGELQDG